MAYYVDIKNKYMNVLIKNELGFEYEASTKIGSQLIDFIYYDLIKINELLDHAYVINQFQKESDYNYIFNQADKENIYLRFFVELFLDTINHEYPNKKEKFDELNKHFPREIKRLKMSLFPKVSYKNISKGFLIGVFSLHADIMKQFMKAQLDFCIGRSDAAEYKNLSPGQKLYIFEQWRKDKGEKPFYFKTDIFPSKLMMIGDIEIKDNADVNDLVEEFQKRKPVVKEKTILETGWELMRYEIMKIITENVFVKECAYCGRYFIPEGRSDIKYCSRPIAGMPGKTCIKYGAELMYKASAANDPIREEFRRAYKRNYAKVHTVALSQSDFYKWLEEAKQMRDSCISGEITLDEMKEFLNSDRVYNRKS